jgi:hypothetical protein
MYMNLCYKGNLIAPAPATITPEIPFAFNFAASPTPPELHL